LLGALLAPEGARYLGPLGGHFPQGDGKRCFYPT
jgi:hypothetical protein